MSLFNSSGMYFLQKQFFYTLCIVIAQLPEMFLMLAHEMQLCGKTNGTHSSVTGRVKVYPVAPVVSVSHLPFNILQPR
jgi:hypothetical protein